MTLRLGRRRELACRQAIQLMSDYVDGHLAGHERTRLERHLADCPYCLEYLKQLRVTIAALGHVEPGDLSDTALDEFVELYRRWRSGAR